MIAAFKLEFFLNPFPGSASQFAVQRIDLLDTLFGLGQQANIVQRDTDLIGQQFKRLQIFRLEYLKLAALNIQRADDAFTGKQGQHQTRTSRSQNATVHTFGLRRIIHIQAAAGNCPANGS